MKPTFVARQAASSVSPEGGDVDAADGDGPGIDLVYARDKVEEGRFARARRAHEGKKLPLFDGKGNVR